MPPTWQHRRLLPPTDTAKTLTHGSIPLREMQNDLYTSDDLEITPRQNGWEILGHLLTMNPTPSTEPPNHNETPNALLLCQGSEPHTSTLTFFINLFSWEANYFTILWWFFVCIDMNQPGVYTWSHPEPPLPSGLSQCTGFECPVSCIELGLVMSFTYGNIHVSMLFSQIIPPSPSPTESKSLFFTSVSLLLSPI